ncbi:MAG: PDZ domain-containing protein [Planctomycetota bacterium]
MWPLPERLGLILDSTNQAMLAGVTEPAVAAGLQSGDVIQSINGQAVTTFGDVQYVLEHLPADADSVVVRFRRDTALVAATIRMKPDWQKAPDQDVAWRPYAWGIDPQPGFSGRDVTADERAGAGLPADQYAFRIQYFAMRGGEAAPAARNAEKAGLRKNDIVISTGGHHNFSSHRHWQVWFRLSHQPGDEVTFEIIRDGKNVTIKMTLLDE